jgi:hypothetical protein
MSGRSAPEWVDVNTKVAIPRGATGEARGGSRSDGEAGVWLQVSQTLARRPCGCPLCTGRRACFTRKRYWSRLGR